MNSRRRKSVLASVISLVLIYYSAAWAVLLCYHDYDRAPGAVEAFERDQPAHRHVSVLGGDSARIDCTDFDYHSEILARPTASPKIDLSMLLSVSHFDDLVAVGSRPAGYGSDSSVTSVWTGAQPINVPVYLFVSDLRI